MRYNTVRNKFSGYVFILVSLLGFLLLPSSVFSKDAGRYYYQIKVYHFENKQQEERLDNFFRDAYLPALRRAGIPKVGVFKPITQDATDKTVYVFIPFKKLEQFEQLAKTLEKDKQYLEAGKDFLNSQYNNAPYTRFESTLLLSFSGMPAPEVPNLTTPKTERFYELRSYESATEKYHENKVKMFNVGEISIFKKLNFNAVFYGQVISGSKMPNLMYMTAFTGKAERDKHWEAFTPEYSTIRAMPEYQNNVSKNVQFYLYPMDYSDY